MKEEYPYSFNDVSLKKINGYINKFINREEIRIFEIGSRDAADAFFLCTLNSKIKIISFDGSPTFKDLSKNFLEMCPRIEINESLISDKNGEVNFFLTKNFIDDEQYRLGSAASSILKPKLGLNGLPIESFKKIKVKSITGKEAIKKFFIPSALILDVQGAELNVLKSFKDDLSNIELIFTEVNLRKNEIYFGDYGVNKLINYLKKYKFNLLDSYNITQYSADLIFIKSKNSFFSKSAYFKLWIISGLKRYIKKFLRIKT